MTSCGCFDKGMVSDVHLAWHATARVRHDTLNSKVHFICISSSHSRPSRYTLVDKDERLLVRGPCQTLTEDWQCLILA